MLSLLAQSTSGSPFGDYAPALPLALCVLAGAATWLLMPRPSGSKTLNHVGAGLGIIAFGTFLVLLIQWAAVANGLTTVYFWVFAFIALAGSVRVITHPQPVYSSLFFVLTVFASAGLFVLMWAEFLAMALVIIYAGAILVTYTFVIMLASEASGEGIVSNLAGDRPDHSAEPMEHDVTPRSPLLACLGGFVTMGALLFVIFNKSQAIQSHGPLQPNDAARVSGNIQQLGVYLFTQQAIALELAGLILTLAMVGAMMIARKRVLLSEEEHLTSGSQLDEYITGDDNPHSISVYGQTGPRTRKPDREMAEL
jgi:NADH-quinone oxidoreductase subunit J